MFRRMVWPLVFGVAGTLILIGLGLWQLDRLHQKEATLAAIAARIGEEPVPLPPAPDPLHDAYLAVRVEGEMTTNEIVVLSSMRNVGPGFRLITAFVTSDGRRILVDRGFLPDAERALPRPGGAAQISGNLQWPRERDGYTPSPDRTKNLWFARDVEAMAKELKTEPVLVVLRTTNEASPAAMIIPVGTEGIPNRHLEYALTWFSLAAVWAGMTGYLLWRIRARED